MIPRRPRSRQGFTLIELLVAVALVAVVLVIAAPSMRNMIEMQRLRSIAAQMVTDIQFARTEAASRQERVGVSINVNSWQSPVAMTCYTVHTCGDNAAPNFDTCVCYCWAPEGSRCSAPQREIRTVQVLLDTGVQIDPIPNPPSVRPANSLQFDSSTGAMAARVTGIGVMSESIPGDAWALARLTRPPVNPPGLRMEVSPVGRPSLCSPGARVSGVTACP